VQQHLLGVAGSLVMVLWQIV